MRLQYKKPTTTDYQREMRGDNSPGSVGLLHNHQAQHPHAVVFDKMKVRNDELDLFRLVRLLIRVYVWSCGRLTPHVWLGSIRPRSQCVCGRHVAGTVVL